MHGSTVRVEVFRQGEAKGHGRFYANHKDDTCLAHHRFNPDIAHESDLPMFEPMALERAQTPEVPERKTAQIAQPAARKIAESAEPETPQIPYTEKQAEVRNENEGGDDGVVQESGTGTGNEFLPQW